MLTIKYIDVTNCYLKNVNIKNCSVINRNFFVDKNGIKYVVDGKNVVFKPSNDEVNMANWLVKKIGGNIYLNPKVNYPENITTPDYLWNNQFWDLKTMGDKAISKSRAVDNIIKKAKYQTDNIILDVSKCKLDRENIIKQVKKIYSTKGREWLNIIIVVDNYKLLKIYKRK